MPIYQYDIVIWENDAGVFTAVPVEDLDLWRTAEEELAGVGMTAREAVQQLTDFLLWLAKEKDETIEPRLNNPRCLEITVPLRPEYQQTARRVFEDYHLRIPLLCVYGDLEQGRQLVCAPTSGVRFQHVAAEPLKPLFTQQVQQHLHGKTVAELARLLPPQSYRLDTLSLKLSSAKPRHLTFKPDLPALSATAEALGQTTGRRRSPPAWEREANVSDLCTRLSEENSPILIVGESGCGKTTVLLEAVRRLAQQTKPEHPRFWQTSGQRLIASMKYLGAWEERCEAVIRELNSINGVLCVENLLELVLAGGSGPTDSVASFFLPYLHTGELRLIAEATPAELDAGRRLLPQFAECFQTLTLPALTRDQMTTILTRMGTDAEKNNRVVIQPTVSPLITALFERFYPYAAFPGKAARFLRTLLDQALQKHPSEIDAAQVIDLFVQQSGLPELFLRDDVAFGPDDVFQELRAKVIGQNPACQIAANIIATFKAGLNDPLRPIGVLLFCGPTGVGKTYLAKAIAKICFGAGEDTQRLIRLDMSEYAGSGAAERLTGSESELIKKVRQQPFMVVLFDEIEKAAPEVFDMLLGLLDEGRLTDVYGRVTNFRSAIIIMTSNLGVKTTETIGFGADGTADYQGAILQFFRPELYNRLDAVVAFHHLAPEDIRRITILELERIASREGFAKRNIRLSWSNAVVDLLTERGYDKSYGARNLQRTIEDTIVTPLARYLLRHPTLTNAHLKIRLDTEGQIQIAHKN